jgi:hypothetical protein
MGKGVGGATEPIALSIVITGFFSVTVRFSSRFNPPIIVLVIRLGAGELNSCLTRFQSGSICLRRFDRTVGP